MGSERCSPGGPSCLVAELTKSGMARSAVRLCALVPARGLAAVSAGWAELGAAAAVRVNF